MKKLLIASLLIVTTVSIGYGLKKNFDSEELRYKVLLANNELETIKISTTAFQKEMEEITNQNTQLAKERDNLILHLRDLDNNIPKNAVSPVTITDVGYLAYENDKSGYLDKIAEELRKDGKNPIIIYPDANSGDTRAVKVETTEKITNIGVKSLGDDYYSNYYMNTYAYLIGKAVSSKEDIIEELNPNDVLLFTTSEGDLSPLNALYWTDINNNFNFSDLFFGP